VISAYSKCPDLYIRVCNYVRAEQARRESDQAEEATAGGGGQHPAAAASRD